MFLELKKYDLRFIRYEADELRIGMNVTIDNVMPISKANFRQIIRKKEDNRLGVIYGVEEDGNTEWYISDKLQPISPVLVSDDVIGIKDIFYVEVGEMYICERLAENGDIITEINNLVKAFKPNEVRRVIASPSKFGWGFNLGPPHDHNRDWKYDEENKRYTYLEDYHPLSLSSAIENDCKLIVVVEEICPHYNGSHIGKDCSCKSGFLIRPKLHDGKIIMDIYGLLEEPHQGYYFH